MYLRSQLHSIAFMTCHDYVWCFWDVLPGEVNWIDVLSAKKVLPLSYRCSKWQYGSNHSLMQHCFIILLFLWKWDLKRKFLLVKVIPKPSLPFPRDANQVRPPVCVTGVSREWFVFSPITSFSASASNKKFLFSMSESLVTSTRSLHQFCVCSYHLVSFFAIWFCAIFFVLFFVSPPFEKAQKV